MLTGRSPPLLHITDHKRVRTQTKHPCTSTHLLTGVSSLPRSARVYLHLGGRTIARTILLYHPDLAKSIAVFDLDRLDVASTLPPLNDPPPPPTPALPRRLSNAAVVLSPRAPAPPPPPPVVPGGTSSSRVAVSISRRSRGCLSGDCSSEPVSASSERRGLPLLSSSGRGILHEEKKERVMTIQIGRGL